MGYRLAIPNFSKGEIAPDLYGRFDVDAYSSSARKARNVMVLKYGGLTKRPGTRYVAEVRDASKPVRLLPFQFSFEQTYALEMGHGYMRVASGGGIVLNEELAITAIANSAHTQISAAFHGYSVGDEVYLSGIAAPLGDYLNNRFWTVVGVPNAGAFTIDADTTSKGAFTSATGGITRAGAPDPDPVDPPVPPPVPEPEPPYVGGHCVVVSTPVLMADGSEKNAGNLAIGDMVRTQHEQSMEWGDYRISAISFVKRPVWFAILAGRGLRSTAEHRVWTDRWVRMDEIGSPDGVDMVAKITVDEAHTYVSNGILSHNIKADS